MGTATTPYKQLGPEVESRRYTNQTEAFSSALISKHTKKVRTITKYRRNQFLMNLFNMQIFNFRGNYCI